MLIGRSPAILRLNAEIGRVAQTEFTVLVTGESGTGKELVARSLHARSPRSSGPFVAVNCAALVESLLEAELFGIADRTATGVQGRRGKFELAEGGTLFLDEVGDLSPIAQAKVLRVLQDRHVERVGGPSTRRVNTRIVVATNRSLPEAVSAGRFRQDLYYRLAGVDLHVPPLRLRKGDVALLVDHFLDRHRGARRVSASPEAVEALTAFDWPGNVRQLERVLERALALGTGPAILLADLPDDITRDFRHLVRPQRPHNTSLRAWSSRYARLVLERCRGNKRRACRELDISYHTLRGLIEYGAGASHGDARALTIAGSPLDESSRVVHHLEKERNRVVS
jgi:transcriptional regulator with PAS, ATPase and Fis domain